MRCFALAHGLRVGRHHHFLLWILSHNFRAIAYRRNDGATCCVGLKFEFSKTSEVQSHSMFGCSGCPFQFFLPLTSLEPSNDHCFVAAQLLAL